MNHATLFSGIGGPDLAAEWMGWNNVFHCEIGEYQRVKLKQKFQSAITYEDITNTDFSIHNGTIDVVTGGFPCQDISAANFKSIGIKGSRSGLWEHFKRAIKEISPRYCVIENSPELLKKGFEKVLYDLSEIGYDAQWECISASSFGFPHKRERLFVVAYPNEFGQQRQGNIFANISYNKESRDWETNRVINAILQKTLPPLCESNHGFPERLVVNGVKTQGNAALHALGNAIVPQVIYQIYKSIEQYEQCQQTLK